jgi:hypothetical protein
LAIVVSGNASANAEVATEEAAKVKALESARRSHAQALDHLRSAKDERRSCLDAALCDLDMLHRVSKKKPFVIFFILLVIAPTCRDGSGTIDSGLSFFAKSSCNFQEDIEAAKMKAIAARKELAEERERTRRLEEQLAALSSKLCSLFV